MTTYNPPIKEETGPIGPVGLGGPIGQVGQRYVSNGNITSWQVPTINSGTVILNNVELTGNNGKSISVGEVVDFMDSIKDRLLILTPDFEKHEKFPALKELYDQYRVMERLMIDDLNKNT